MVIIHDDNFVFGQVLIYFDTFEIGRVHKIAVEQKVAQYRPGKSR